MYKNYIFVGYHRNVSQLFTLSCIVFADFLDLRVLLPPSFPHGNAAELCPTGSCIHWHHQLQLQGKVNRLPTSILIEKQYRIAFSVQLSSRWWHMFTVIPTEHCMNHAILTRLGCLQTCPSWTGLLTSPTRSLLPWKQRCYTHPYLKMDT